MLRTGRLEGPGHDYLPESVHVNRAERSSAERGVCVDEAELTLHCIAALRHPPALRTATVASARAGRLHNGYYTKATYAPSTAQTAIALTVSSSVWSKTRPKMPVAARARVSGMPRQQARGVLCGRAQQQPSSTISPGC